MSAPLFVIPSEVEESTFDFEFTIKSTVGPSATVGTSNIKNRHSRGIRNPEPFIRLSKTKLLYFPCALKHLTRWPGFTSTSSGSVSEYSGFA